MTTATLLVAAAIVLLAAVWTVRGMRRRRALRDRTRMEDALKHLFHQQYRGRLASFDSLGGALRLSDSRLMQLLARMQHQNLVVARGREFELTPDGDGCVLVFTHAFADRDTAARTAAGWDRCFARLDALLEEHPMGEKESLEAWPEVHERYAEEFGVDPELGRQAYAEHPTQQ